MKDTCILIIDDHALFRTGMSMILSDHGDIGEVMVADSIEDALSFCNGDSNTDRQKRVPSLILLDIELPNIRGTEGIELLLNAFGPLPIVMLSAVSDMASFEQAEKRGARGFLHKSSEAEDIVKSIKVVLSGGTCFDRSIFATSPTTPHAIEGRITELTDRQIEVLKTLCEGLSNKLIARRLNVSENTVRVHVSAILTALGAPNRSAAILIAQREGIHEL